MDTGDLIQGPMPLLPLIFGGSLISVAVLLLTAGRKTLRFSFGLAGLVIGVAIGWLISDALVPGMPPWIGGALGGAAIGAVFLLLFRLAVALSLGTVLMVVAPLTLLTFGVVQSDHANPEDVPREVDGAAGRTESAPSRESLPRSERRNGANERHEGESGVPAPVKPAAPDPVPASDPAPEPDGEPTFEDELESAARDIARQRAEDAVRSAIDRELERHPETKARLDAFAQWAAERRAAAMETWEGVGAEGRYRLRAAMAAGFVVALLIGFLLSDLSTILASAGAGSALALIGLRLIAEPLALDWLAATLDRPAVVAGAWTILALAGTTLQWTRRGRRADNGRRGA